MKQSIVLFTVLLITLNINAQVKFETSLTEAFKLAKEQNKIVFIEYYNSDCSVCQRLGDILKKDLMVASFYNKNFINYAMNTNGSLSDEDEAFILEANLHFESVPVLLYFDNDKKFLHHSSVNVNAEYIINEGKKAIHPDFRTSDLKSKYENGDRTVKTLYAYCNLLIIQKNEDLLNRVSQELFEVFKKEELPTKKSYIVLKQVVISTENGFFQYWINHLDALKGFESGFKEGTEKSYLKSIVLKELSDKAVKNWDKSKKDKFREYILKLKITSDPEVFFE